MSTLGAGDVFHGALVAQLIQGFPLQEAMLRANAVAALSCTGLDGQSEIPTTIELDTYLEAHK
jgi:sulfofructose kinase